MGENAVAPKGDYARRQQQNDLLDAGKLRGEQIAGIDPFGNQHENKHKRAQGERGKLKQPECDCFSDDLFRLLRHFAVGDKAHAAAYVPCAF